MSIAQIRAARRTERNYRRVNGPHPIGKEAGDRREQQRRDRAKGLVSRLAAKRRSS